jgi:beta-glucanase (GH16 family)
MFNFLLKSSLIFLIACSLGNYLMAQSKVKKLVWSEEFNYNGLPDDTKWSYNEGTGCPQICGWGNNELEYYTTKDLSNAKVENGVLKITALKQAKENSAYTSARIVSKNKAVFKYGRMECRAKLPTSKGTWPSFWMLGSNFDKVGWPACGEIDIMEHKGNDLNKIYGTLHYPKHFGENGNGKTTMIKDVSKFHIYSVEWSEKMISFFVDGKQYNQIENDETLPFNQNFYFIINLAIGGNFAGAVDPGLLNETMEVDYVRVYQ